MLGVLQKRMDCSLRAAQSGVRLPLPVSPEQRGGGVLAHESTAPLLERLPNGPRSSRHDQAGPIGLHESLGTPSDRSEHGRSPESNSDVRHSARILSLTRELSLAPDVSVEDTWRRRRPARKRAQPRKRFASCSEATVVEEPIDSIRAIAMLLHVAQDRILSQPAPIPFSWAHAGSVHHLLRGDFRDSSSTRRRTALIDHPDRHTRV